MDDAETRGAYAARLNTAPPGFAAVPLHVHQGAEEGFLVLEGELAVHAGGRVVTAVAGAFVLVPRGLVHAIANRSGVPVRWLTLISPRRRPGGWRPSTTSSSGPPGPRPGPARGDPPPVRPGDRRATAVVGLRPTAGAHGGCRPRVDVEAVLSQWCRRSVRDG